MAKARYGSGSIRQRGRIFWVLYREVIRRPDGIKVYKQHRETTGSVDRDYAERFLRRKLAEIGGRRPAQIDPKKFSYEDLRENFLAHCVDKKSRSLKWDKNNKPTLATLPRLDGFFGNWRANDFTVADMKRFRAEGKREGLSDARLNRYIATLRAMLKQAAKDELIPAAQLPTYFPTVAEPNEAVGAVFIEPQWYTSIRRTLTEPLRSAFALAYGTGVRVEEMWRLRWRHVDAKKRKITLPGDITKTGRQRVIYLPKDFDLKPGQPDTLVFPIKNHRWEWYDACCQAGAGYFECRACGARCTGRTCPTHGRRNPRALRYRGALLRHCRHTFVRDASDSRLPEKRIMDITGHKTRSVFDRYNLGKEKDVAESGKTVEDFRRKRK